MNNCKTCVYWTRFKNTNMGQCGLIDFYYGYSFKDDDIGVDVEVSDDSGLSITVKTGENFGCIKHEIK